MAQNKLVLIFGAGPNIGAAVTKLFRSNGYSVALVSRKGASKDADPKCQHLKADLTQPHAVAEVFEAVQKKHGSAPNVVIYNAASVHFSPIDNPLSVQQSDFDTDLAVNLTSAYAAAQLAVQGFETLPEDIPKSFFYTGNALNVTPHPLVLTLGVGKTAMAHTIECAAGAYAAKGWTFYYSDERFEDGSPVRDAISGSAHAERFWELSQDRTQHHWLDTFVAGIGYKKFEPKPFTL